MQSKLLSAFVNKLVQITRKISLLALVLLGIAVIVATIYLALNTPTKVLAILVASLGSSIGTGIIALTLPKISDLRVKEELVRITEEERVRIVEVERLKIELTQQSACLKEKEIEQKKNEAEIEKLQAEIERHKRMRVDVNFYKPVLKLGMAELDIDTCDYKRQLLERNDRVEWDPRRSSSKEYIGVIRHKFRATFGVDLMKLRFSEIELGVLEISGLHSEFQGMIPEPVQDQWELVEVREHLTKGALLNESYSVVSSDKMSGSNEYVSHAKEQEREFIGRVQKGLEFKSLDDHIVKMAKEFLRVIFSPLAQELVFADSVNIRGRGFTEYLEFKNRSVEEHIQQLENQKLLLKC
ncbi:MAG: hypothetical protein ABL902_05870 [Gallionella sp.]|nr:hypothetical protein [Gallionella sp.]